jgi:predicted DNA-binding antitoxin AbrB/MazE fold protein
MKLTGDVHVRGHGESEGVDPQIASCVAFEDTVKTEGVTPGESLFSRGIIESRRNVTTIDVDAVYENGILTLKHPVDLPENAEVHVTIQTAAEARTPLGRRLRELRAEIARSGMAPLGWDEIESEVAVRRGGWREGS